jgi:hypothetical protein
LYHYEAASEDVETQRKGIVVVARIDNTMIDNYLQAAPEVKKDVIDSLTHIPIRYSAQHYCILDDSPFVMQMFKGLWGFINRSKDERFRVQIYSGLEMEVRSGFAVLAPCLGRVLAFTMFAFLRRQSTN